MDLSKRLRQCVVTVKISGNNYGTGFFILPGHILTCAHVVKEAEEKDLPVQIIHGNEKLSAAIIFYQPDYPDISLLKVEYYDHSCVFLLENVKIKDTFYGFGYHDKRLTGDSLTVEYEGPTGPPVQYKLKKGQVSKGMSGSPLLNLSTGGVCGFIKSTRNRGTSLGGSAIPISEVFSAVSRLREKHYSFHQENKEVWLNFLSNDQCRETYKEGDRLNQLKQILRNKVKSEIRPCIRELPSMKIDSDIFFGRENYLKMLNDAWINGETNIFCFVAWGGIGKTTLVTRWLNEMQRKNWDGAAFVFVWSFYKQGTTENAQVSAESFFHEALKYFGEDHPEKIKNKGVHLAELVKKEKSLIFLDGLEPLQGSPSDGGRVTDYELDDFLKEISVYNPGLCIITTRVKIETNFIAPTVVTEILERLSCKSGVALLKHYGLQGSDKEFSDAVEEFEGHALTLNLLGNLIKRKEGKRIDHYKNIEKLAYERDNLGKHTKRILYSYEKWFTGSTEGKQCLNLLYIMGLFDRPAPFDAIRVVAGVPVIDGLNDKVLGFSEVELGFVINDLIELSLLSDKDKCGIYDCHPLIREYVREQLIKNKPAWREANNRLFQFYKNLPFKEFPDTFEEMEPLFQSIPYGCHAERHQEVLEEIYWKRILRGEEHYAIHVLGAIREDLSALSSFFEPSSSKWNKVSSNLSPTSQNAVLFFTGYDLRALGRLKEAAVPLKKVLEADRKIKDWRNAAISAGYISELYLTLGNVNRSAYYAKESLSFPDPENETDIFMQRTRLCDLLEKIKQKYRFANTLHQKGDLIESESLFREAEKEEKMIEPTLQYVHSLSGFWFCDLLLSLKKYDEVIERSEYTITFSLKKNWIREAALDKISLGRAVMLKQVESGEKKLHHATTIIEESVFQLEKSNQKHYLPFGLLAKSALHRIQREFDQAKKDLDKIKEIADRDSAIDKFGVTKEWSSMGLFLIDYYLELCRLLIDKNNKKEAMQHFLYAKEKIEQLGYYRRVHDIKELQAALV